MAFGKFTIPAHLKPERLADVVHSDLQAGAYLSPLWIANIDQGGIQGSFIGVGVPITLTRTNGEGYWVALDPGGAVARIRDTKERMKAQAEIRQLARLIYVRNKNGTSGYVTMLERDGPLAPHPCFMSGADPDAWWTPSDAQIRVAVLFDEKDLRRYMAKHHEAQPFSITIARSERCY